MEKFVALCSPEAEFHLKFFPGFAGRINFQTKNPSNLIDLNEIPDEVSIIRVGPNYPPFYRLLADNPKALEKRKVIIGLLCRGYTPGQLELQSLTTIDATNCNKVDILRALESWIYVKRFNKGPMNYADAVALLDLIYSHIKKLRGQPIRVLEIGSALGTSTVTMARAIQISGTYGEVYCVDPWEIYISPPLKGFPLNRQNRYFDSFDTWQRTMKMMQVQNIAKPLRISSDEAFGLFAECIFDIVYLDGDHRYDGFFRDVYNTLRVIKPGGLLAGHDSECFAGECDEQFLIENRDVYDGSARHDGKIIHTGVVLALRDIFSGNFGIYRDSSIWHKLVTPDDKNNACELTPANYPNP